MVEQWTENPCVPGSIPGGTTTKARMVKLVDTLDLKSSEQQCSCGFKSRSEYIEKTLQHSRVGGFFRLNFENFKNFLVFLKFRNLFFISF